MDESFRDGFIPKRLYVQMEVRRHVFGSRWDSVALELKCETLDDCQAAFCLAFSGEYFLALKTDKTERDQWRLDIASVAESSGFLSFERVFELHGRNRPGVQIWSANEFGESRQGDIIITGEKPLLTEIIARLDSSVAGGFSTSFVFGEAAAKWVDI